MGTIGANKLATALAKAKNVGLVEESFTIEGCEITLRNLRPEEGIDILKACEGLEDVEYLHTYQMENISRSIVEVNGVDLREVQFVEQEEEGTTGEPRTIKLEIHDYLTKNLLSTWSKEAIYIAYRKFTDVVELAERKSKEGVKFVLPEETVEDRFRRLLAEAKECEDDLPGSLIDHILDDSGYMRKSTAEELKEAMKRTDQLAREQEASEAAQEELEQAATTPPPQPQAPVQTAPEARQPMNQAPSRQPLPPDPHKTLQDAIQARQAPTPQAEPQEDSSKPSRAERIAALEADANLAGIDVEMVKDQNGKEIPVYRPPNTEVVELRKLATDPQQLGKILDQPPVAGRNPRFRPPPKV